MHRHRSLAAVTLGLLVACDSEELSVNVTPRVRSLKVTWRYEGSREATGFDVLAAAAPDVPVSNGNYGLTAGIREFTFTGLDAGTTYNVVAFAYQGSRVIAKGTAQGTPLEAPTPGTPDAGAVDAGTNDAGLVDAGSGDAGVGDAGVGDAGVMDAGPVDAGPRWVSQSTGDTRQRDLTGVWGSSATNVFVVGVQGAAYQSNDRGSTWTRVMGLPIDQYSGIWGTSATNVYVAAGVTGAGRLYRFNGTSWATVFTGTNPLAAVWGSSATDVYAVGEGGTILHSTDGTTFTAQTSGVTAQLAAVGGVAGDVIVVGANTILRTTTAGATWTAQTPASAGAFSNSVFGLGSGSFLVTTQGGALNRTTNSGTTWAAGPASPTNTAGLYGVWGTGPSLVFVVGALTTGGLIARYDGSTLTPVFTTSSPGDGYVAVWGSGPTDVFAVGAFGAIVHGP